MKAVHEQVKTDIALPVRFSVYQAEHEFVPFHWHNSLEILYIVEGSMEVSLNNRTRRLLAGEFMIINSKEIHSTLCGGKTTVFLLQYPYSFLKTHVPDYDFLRFEDTGGRFRFPGESTLTPFFSRMLPLFADSTVTGRLQLNSFVYGLLAELISGYCVRLSQNDRAKYDKNFIRLSSLIAYVDLHYCENISVSDAAGLLHLEKAYFCRFFKKYMGQTFLSYVNSVRLRHVCDDMSATDLPLMEILSRHGFDNYKVFSRLFRSAYGASPRVKRREWQKNSSTLTIEEPVS